VTLKARQAAGRQESSFFEKKEAKKLFSPLARRVATLELPR
jgi:hypothetical protein